MALRKLRFDGDDVLRTQCKPIKEMTPRLKQLIDDMFETMYHENGVGLAATQIGLVKQIAVMDVGDGNTYVMINPEIIEMSGEQDGGEGCLSIPGRYGDVKRPNHVKVRALDENMQERVIEGEGLLARCICHEVDHLNAILYKDKASDGLYYVN